MGLTSHRFGRRSALSALTVAAVLGTLGVTAPAALADGVSITIDTSAPEQGMPVDATFAGSDAAIDSDGDGAFLYAIDRPADGTPCQATFGADQNLEEDNSDVLEDGTELDPGAFSSEDEIDPDLGPYIVCAWVETDGDDGSVADGGDTVTPDEVTAGPISTSFTAAAPQVGPIKVTVPARITTGQTYTITYATQTDQDLDLASMVIPAAAGPCADSYEDESANGSDIFDGAIDTTGKDTNSGQDSETKAGSYLICSWIEGPDDSQVDATQSTRITVAAPGSGSTSSSGSSTTAGGSGATKSGSGPNSAKSGSGTGTSSGAATGSGSSTTGASTGVCTVPRLTGLTLKGARKRLLASGCDAGAVHWVVTHKVKHGHVVKLSAAPGSEHRHGAAISITLAR